MAKKPKGEDQNGKDSKNNVRGILDETGRDIFGDLPQSDLVVDFGEINPTALHSIIARVCRIGGYISFSAPAGGNAVKLGITVGDLIGKRWCHDGHELASALLTVHQQLEKIPGK